MAQRKADVSAKELQGMKVPEVLALHGRVSAGAASTADRELLQRAVMFLRGRYREGRLSEKVARQLGIA